MLKLIVFDVEQGQCVYVRTPNDYGILIDCGRSPSGETASPAKWLAGNEASSLTQINGHALASLIVTHPHENHVKDIDAVMQHLSPAIVYGETGGEWQSSVDSLEGVDLGATVHWFSLSQAEAEQLGGGPRSITNNRSLVTVISYKSAEGYAWKIVVAGDNDARGWEALLAKPEFRAEIAETDFFVTSCHGRESGFCAETFAAMGKPLANISCTSDDEQVDRRYKKQAQGVKFPDGSRTHFITHGDGNITVEMKDDGKYDVWLFTP